MKKVFLGVGGSILVAGAIYVYLVEGLRHEALVQSYHRFFAPVVARAIQLESLGVLEVQTSDSASYPEAYSIARDAIQDLNLSKKQANCSLSIRLEPIDTTRFYPAIGVALSYDPLHYLVFFFGPPPNLTHFMDRSRNEELIGPVLSYGEPSPEYNESGFLLNGFDLTRSFATISRKHPNGVKWRSVQCAEYSFIEFTGGTDS